MGYFDTDHLGIANIVEPVDERAGNIFANIEQGFRQQREVDSPYALEAELQERWQTSLDAYARMTGKPVDLPLDLSSFNTYARTSLGQAPSLWQQSPGLDGFFVNEDTQQKIASFKATNEALKATDNPEIKSFEQVLAEVMDLRRGISQESASLSEDSGTLGKIAEFVGAIAGSINTRDPLTLATLGIGGVGKTAAARIATEVGIGAALTAPGAFAGESTRELLGEGEGNPLFEILAGGVGAGVIRGGFEAASRVFSGRDLEPLDLDDAQMRSMFQAAEQTPRVRAAQMLLDDVDFVKTNNPFGDGPSAEARFMAELSEVQQVMGGAPMTAVARALPPLPVEYIAKADDFKLVREQSPQVWAKFEQAQAAIRTIDERTIEIEEGLNSTQLIDVVRLVDARVADELENLARVVNDPAVPEPVRPAADLRAQNMMTALGEERLAKAANDAEIKPRQEIKRLAASRKAANKRLRAATKEVEAERTAILRRQDILRGLQQREAVDLLGNGMVGRPFLLPELNLNRVAEFVQQVDRSDEVTELLAEQIYRRAVPEKVEGKAQIREGDDGLYDIGGPRIDPTFRIPVEQADGSIRDMSAKEIFNDFEADEALAEAVKVCAI